MAIIDWPGTWLVRWREQAFGRTALQQSVRSLVCSELWNDDVHLWKITEFHIPTTVECIHRWLISANVSCWPHVFDVLDNFVILWWLKIFQDFIVLWVIYYLVQHCCVVELCTLIIPGLVGMSAWHQSFKISVRIQSMFIFSFHSLYCLLCLTVYNTWQSFNNNWLIWMIFVSVMFKLSVRNIWVFPLPLLITEYKLVKQKTK